VKDEGGTMWHCDACGWHGETPALREWAGEGCGGVVWTLRICPACGEEVSEVVEDQDGAS
jgi:hypothetical protein